jgi:hypothetical protein
MSNLLLQEACVVAAPRHATHLKVNLGASQHAQYAREAMPTSQLQDLFALVIVMSTP